MWGSLVKVWEGQAPASLRPSAPSIRREWGGCLPGACALTPPRTLPRAQGFLYLQESKSVGAVTTPRTVSPALGPTSPGATSLDTPPPGQSLSWPLEGSPRGAGEQAVGGPGAGGWEGHPALTRVSGQGLEGLCLDGTLPSGPAGAQCGCSGGPGRSLLQAASLL